MDPTSFMICPYSPSPGNKNKHVMKKKKKQQKFNKNLSGTEFTPPSPPHPVTFMNIPNGGKNQW